MAGLFGANGDAQGLATVSWPQIDVQFSSASGGIGQLAGLPAIVISVPVLASAAGRTVTVSATSPDSSVSVASGSVTVEGTLSVREIPAGMGTVPAGTVVPVYGAEPGIAAVGLMSMPMPGTTFVRCDHAGQSQNCGAEREFVRGRTARVQEKAHQFQHLVVSRLEHSNSCASMVNDPSTQGAVTLLWNP